MGEQSVVKTRFFFFVRSLGAGALATAADLLTLFMLVTVMSVNLRLASPIALVLGVAVQFLGQKLVAFRDTRPRWARQALAFSAVELLGFFANIVVFDLASRFLPLPYLVVRVLTTNLVYFAICMPLWSRIFASPLEPRTSRDPGAGDATPLEA